MQASTDFMYVTLVTEDDPKMLQNKMSQSQEIPRDPCVMGKGKAKNKMIDVKTIQAKKKIVDYRIPVIYKDGIDAFKCEECGGSLKSRTWAKQHLTKKHRARTDDDWDDKEEKNERMEGEQDSIKA